MTRSFPGVHGLVVATTLALVAPTAVLQAQSPRVDPAVAQLLAKISPDRLGANIQKLQSFHTRLTASTDLTGGQGIKAAREWILQEMKSYGPRLQVSLDCYTVPPGGRIAREIQLCNVMAVLPGRSPRRIYISGHYDSVARVPGQGFDWSRTDNFAPGANDDGSGTSLTMELARQFAQSDLDFDATMVFIAFAGEEEGLVGARLHARKAAQDSVRIDAVLNNDMVSNVSGGYDVSDSRTVRVFSEGPEDSGSRELARYLRRWAGVYLPGHVVRLIAREDRFGRGGDHTAFNQAGYTAVRVTESKENYTRQHSVDDTFEGVNVPYLTQNAQMDAAVAATLALAPPAPVVTRRGNPTLGRGQSGYDADLRWQASPGAVGYKIFWREAWTPDWQHELDVGNVTETVLSNMSIDDYIYGVAAVDAAGHESLVAPYVRLPRGFGR